MEAEPTLLGEYEPRRCWNYVPRDANKEGEECQLCGVKTTRFMIHHYKPNYDEVSLENCRYCFEVLACPKHTPFLPIKKNTGDQDPRRNTCTQSFIYTQEREYCKRTQGSGSNEYHFLVQRQKRERCYISERRCFDCFQKHFDILDEEHEWSRPLYPRGSWGQASGLVVTVCKKLPSRRNAKSANKA